MKTAKHDTMRNANTLSVLACIRDFGPLTKRDIQRRTGLSWGAVSIITSELLKKEIINENKSEEITVGRKPSNLDINGTRNLIVGVDINIEGLTAVTIDLRCKVLGIAREDIIKNDKEAIIAQVKGLIGRLLQATDIRLENVIGIGVAMQGAVDVDKGISIYAPHFENWQNVPLKDMLEEYFGITVYVEHDPNCMALSERWMGLARNVDNLLMIRLSMGVGMSILINGELYRGADGSAGEFGHITMNPGGVRCSCGNYGCLEAYASGTSILQRASEGLKLGRTSAQLNVEGSGEITLAGVAAAARQGDAFINGLFDEAGIYLGIGISNLINLLNPQLIVIGGELVGYGDLFLDKAIDIATRRAWRNSRVRIERSRLGGNPASVGAAAMFIQKFFNGELAHIIQ